MIVPAAQSMTSQEDMQGKLGNLFEFTALTANALAGQPGNKAMMTDVAAEAPAVESKIREFLAEALPTKLRTVQEQVESAVTATCSLAMFKHGKTFLANATVLAEDVWLLLAHNMSGANHELPPLAKGEQFGIAVRVRGYLAQVERPPLKQQCLQTNNVDAAVVVSLNRSFHTQSPNTLPSRGQATGFGSVAHHGQATKTTRFDRECGFYVHVDGSGLRSGNSGTTMVLEAGDDKLMGSHIASNAISVMFLVPSGNQSPHVILSDCGVHSNLMDLLVTRFTRQSLVHEAAKSIGPQRSSRNAKTVMQCGRLGRGLAMLLAAGTGH